jgi:hypothetical protein
MFACGNESLLLPLQKNTVEFQIKSLADGQILFSGDTIPIEITSTDTQSSKDLELAITVYSLAGDKVWEFRIPAPALNEPLPPLKLPDMITGQYRLELVVLSTGDEVQKSSTVFFSSKTSLKISGIKSFPSVITTGSPVLLKAELEDPEGSDPYLRWAWRGKTIAGGLSSEGFGEILWTAPEDEGIYTITLELFPSAPGGTGKVVFRSSIFMSTDIYVSAVKKPDPNELGPESSYSTLFHFQASFQESGQAEKGIGVSAAAPIGAPRIVATEDGFGYSLLPGSGISIPWFIIPLKDSTIQPFTVNIGVRVESPMGEAALYSIQSGDGSFSFAVSFQADGLSPSLILSGAGLPDLTVPSNILMEKEQRHVVSLSVAPREPKGFVVQWFLDGEQTNSLVSDQQLPQLNGEGKAIIGGEKGFTGIVDEFGVYTRDEKGNPSIESNLFSREAEKKLKDTLVEAEGFDGTGVPAGFTIGEPGSLSAGFVSLPAKASLTIPALTVPDEGMDASIILSAASSQAAVLIFQWKKAESSFLETPITAVQASFTFSIMKDKVSLQGVDGVKAVKVPLPTVMDDLVVRIEVPGDAAETVIVDRILIKKSSS